MSISRTEARTWLVRTIDQMQVELAACRARNDPRTGERTRIVDILTYLLHELDPREPSGRVGAVNATSPALLPLRGKP